MGRARREGLDTEERKEDTRAPDPPALAGDGETRFSLDIARPMGMREKRAMLAAAAAEAISAEEFTAHIRQALAYAEAQKSPRSIIMVLEFIRDTAVGKPGTALADSGDDYVDIITVIQQVANRRASEQRASEV